MTFRLPHKRFHTGIFLFGGLSYVLYRGKLSSSALYQAALYLSFAAFILCLLDVLLFYYQSRRLIPLKPRANGIALVTGASSGVGREIAYLLAEKGFSLMLVARTESTLARMAKEIHDVLGMKVFVCPADLSKTATSVQTIQEFVQKNNLQVDILVNCAGLGHHGIFHEQSNAQVNEMIDLNVASLVNLTHTFLPDMILRNCGRILNIGSIAGASPMPTTAIYGATKAFVIRFSQAINYECRHTNVSVSVINPGPIPTNFQKTCGMPEAMLFHLPGMSGEVKAVASTAVDAMLAGTETVYDSYVSELMFQIGVFLVPRRLTAMGCQVMWNPPSEFPKAF
ncbi:hypothetical protein THRCLA_08541 [Thraustotheca clavata]|uniref:Uncharacterized protein n=1 Tax=Thraustotheca clavata TaxID=74557 RepID=A0A1V9Z570_9STRA|nr:hypothetical protein THRCLA_08541 [Thraustotheca clavata]